MNLIKRKFSNVVLFRLPFRLIALLLIWRRLARPISMVNRKRPAVGLGYRLVSAKWVAINLVFLGIVIVLVNRWLTFLGIVMSC